MPSVLGMLLPTKIITSRTRQMGAVLACSIVNCHVLMQILGKVVPKSIMNNKIVSTDTFNFS